MGSNAGRHLCFWLGSPMNGQRLDPCSLLAKSALRMEYHVYIVVL